MAHHRPVCGGGGESSRQEPVEGEMEAAETEVGSTHETEGVAATGSAAEATERGVSVS